MSRNSFQKFVKFHVLTPNCTLVENLTHIRIKKNPHKSTPTEYTHINRNIIVVNLPTVLVYSLCKNVIIVKYFEITVYVITSFYFSHSNYC